MNLVKVTKMNLSKKRDTIIITDACLVNHLVKTHEVKVSSDGAEIIL